MQRRIIKFRAWDKKHPERGMYEIPMDSYNTGDFFWNDRFIIMQFCNFEDMKMVEIYEGDIVQTPDGKYPVVWGVDGWITDSPEPKYLGEIDATVVGHIWEK